MKKKSKDQATEINQHKSCILSLLYYRVQVEGYENEVPPREWTHNEKRKKREREKGKATLDGSRRGRTYLPGAAVATSACTARGSETCHRTNESEAGERVPRAAPFRPYSVASNARARVRYRNGAPISRRNEKGNDDKAISTSYNSGG